VTTVQAFKAAPQALRAAAILSCLEAIVWLGGGVLLAHGSLPGSTTPRLIAGIAIGVLLPVCLFTLPAAAAFSRYPRRRYREALVFQTLLLFVFVDALASDASPLGAVLCASALASVYLLLKPSTRNFVASREGRFRAAVRGH
jgi:predicted permease